jgi:hypothetical protein
MGRAPITKRKTLMFIYFWLLHQIQTAYNKFPQAKALPLFLALAPRPTLANTLFASLIIPMKSGLYLSSELMVSSVVKHYLG